ncbi:ribosome hibernation factor-recruiting GTPase MRF [Antrihabitans sp. YC2-6]|uniref:ribosome hibernation factor-recruiting GTPase MRF n=1 Tax=Antrihabitans sp. YC2-6 TaxID=2799498 RepID=UPI0035A85BC0
MSQQVRRRQDRRAEVVLVSGWSGPTATTARSLLEEGTILVHHDLRDVAQGVVHRTVINSDGRENVSILELVNGCVSCTVRADLLPLLRKLAVRSQVRRIVVELDRTLEPEAVCWAIENVVVSGVVGQIDGPASRDVQVAAVLTCIDAESWLSDATGDDTLAGRVAECGNGPGDDRTVAQVVVGQVEYADALVVSGNAADPLAAAKLTAVLARLAPSVPMLWTDGARLDVRGLLAVVPANARHGAFADPHGPLLRGEPPLTYENGVAIVEFSAARPFHPQRLHEAIDTLLDGVVTARGRIWVATQPENALWLESAGGGLRVGHAGKWLVSMTQPEREAESPERRVMAALRWSDRFGDRDNSLIALVHDADPSEIDRALQWALVTDDELLEQAQWRHWPDPFGDWHEEPCGTSESPFVDSEREDQA